MCKINAEKQEDFMKDLKYGMHSKIKLVDTDGVHKEKSYSIVHKEQGLISFIIKIYLP